MFSFSASHIAQIVNGSVIGDSSVIISNLHIDSRTFVAHNQVMFVAISGHNHNGHDYINELFAKGCRCFLVQRSCEYSQYPEATYIVVDDVIIAFQQIAAWYRRRFTYPLIAITGSNGKTIVKEWLYHILKQDFSIVRSPKSYNSQIGVPLSLLLLQPENNLAIIEAGISQLHEMHLLQKMIQPTIGIFTTIGDAHQENFVDVTQKIREKLVLFSEVSKLVYCYDYQNIRQEIGKLQHVDVYAWGFSPEAPIRVRTQVINLSSTYIEIFFASNTYTFQIPFTDNASIENAIHCFIAAKVIKSTRDCSKFFLDLPRVAMRLEQKAAKHNCTLINDAYNSDFESVKIALRYLFQQRQHESKTLILSDIKQTGIALEQLYASIHAMIQEYGIHRVIGVGHDISKYLQKLHPEGYYYLSTPDFLHDFHTFSFQDETILLKAAREFQFETIAKKLELQTHQTVLEIHLNAIIHNLNYFRSYLQPQTKVMVMVKAFSYGSGSFEIANVLQHHRVDYLAVAFVDEGIELRNAGITLPIVVMNPEIGMLPQIFENSLEPNIHNFSVLHELEVFCKKNPQQNVSIHIKLDTGMARYGFSFDDIPLLISKLKSIEKQCTIISVFSHLVGSDEERFDVFTREQIDLFDSISMQIQNAFSYKILKHIANSAGIERFPQAQFDMVRLGIGLYGISSIHVANCMNVSTLRTFVSDIRTMPAGTTVGYSRKGRIQQPSKIAVLPIGYADGLRRSLSNGKWSVLIRNQLAPIIGNICMDATMIDITHVQAEIGDEVILFGNELPITQMASVLETIPYEVITSISRRVKRIYYYE